MLVLHRVELARTHAAREDTHEDLTSRGRADGLLRDVEPPRPDHAREAGGLDHRRAPFLTAGIRSPESAREPLPC
jgi:hypothetical protein